MTKLFLSISCSILFCVLLVSPLSSAEPDKKLHTDCLYPTLTTLSMGKSGTGFIVRSEKVGDKFRNVFITCAHNLPFNFPLYTVGVGKYKDWSEFEGYDYSVCYYTLINQETDVAIGVFESKSPQTVVTMDFGPMFIGNDILKIGCGLKEPFRLDTGKISSVNALFKPMTKDTYRMNAYTVSGDSGGPVFHDYKVIGITRAIMTYYTEEGMVEVNHMAYAIPIKMAKKSGTSLNIDVDYAFDSKVSLPVLPFIFMKFHDLEPQGNP